MTIPLKIDVVSDVVCPWCYVGKRRLEATLAGRNDITAEIHWHPFFLDPTVPREGKSREDYIVGKFGSLERIKPAHDRLVGVGAEAGIEFNFKKILRQPNSLNAHRVIAWAMEAGNAAPTIEALFKAFFVDGADLTDDDVLARAGAKAGLDAEKVKADLASDRDADLVSKQAQAASASGIGGVPFFVFGGKLAVSGAQEVAVLNAAIDQALAEAKAS